MEPAITAPTQGEVTSCSKYRDVWNILLVMKQVKKQWKIMLWISNVRQEPSNGVRGKK